MDCYVVYFCTGEYDDYRENIIKIFANEDSANDFSDAFSKRLDEIGYNMHGDNRSVHNKETRYNGKIDGHIIDYTGASIEVRGPFEFIK